MEHSRVSEPQGRKVNATCVHQNWVIALSPFDNIYGSAEIHIATSSSGTSIHEARPLI